MANTPGTQEPSDNTVQAVELPFKPPTQPIINFPLPRELRDEIYAYLLDVERVEEIDKQCEAQIQGEEKMPTDGALFGGLRKTYKFTTGIMTVNKTIGDEAREYFASSNRFVRVAFDFAGFQHLRAMMDLPIITILRKDIRIVQECLSIQILWPGGACERIFDDIEGDDNDKGAVVISLSSLPKLCDIVRFLCLIEGPTVPCVASAPGEKLSVLKPIGRSLAKKRTSLQIRVQVQDKHAPQGTKLITVDQQFTLDCIRGIRCAGYDLSTAGFSSHPEMLHATIGTLPAIIFPAPVLLDTMNLMLRMKTFTDDLAASGHSLTAHTRCFALVKWHSRCLKALDEIVKALDSFTAPAEKALRIHFCLFLSLRIDLLCSLLSLALLHSVAEETNHVLLYLHNAQPHMTPRMYSAFIHLSCIAYFENLAYNEMPATRKLFGCKTTLEKLESLLMKDEWIMHDVEVFREFVDAFEDRATTEVEVSKTLDTVKLSEDDTHDTSKAMQQEDEHDISPQ